EPGIAHTFRNPRNDSPVVSRCRVFARPPPTIRQKWFGLLFSMRVQPVRLKRNFVNFHASLK
ncbi:hypothetical protein, partial [Burkholderia sp. SIMBA_048]|uniref:hypothetical protein n=1 Tax=Burkholderia sp. SIMBA_048 TaxID=3085789 RepID=UPI00397BC29A